MQTHFNKGRKQSAEHIAKRDASRKATMAAKRIHLDNLDQETLKRILHYDPETGIWTRLTGRWRGKRAGYESASSEGHLYRKIGICQEEIYEHILAHLYMIGEWPDDQIDHINGIGTDNRWINLRPCDQLHNMWNARMPVTNTSGYLNIRETPSGRWQLHMRLDGKVTYIGRYDTPEEAEAVRDLNIDMHREGIKFDGRIA